MNTLLLTLASSWKNLPRPLHTLVLRTVELLTMADEKEDAIATDALARGENKRNRQDGSDDEQALLHEAEARNVKRKTVVEEPSSSMDTLVLTQMQSDDSTFQLKVLELLAKKMDASVEACKQYYRLAGHIPLVKLVMKNHLNCKDIQERSLHVIATATRPNKELQHSTFMQREGMKAVLHTMDKFPNDQGIQDGGLAVLVELVASPGDCKVGAANAKALVLSHQGFPILLEAVSNFSQDERIVMRAFSIVVALCDIKKVREDVFRRGDVLKTLTTAADAHEENYGIRLDWSRITGSYSKHVDPGWWKRFLLWFQG